MYQVAKKAFAFTASYGFATVLLFLLLILTLFGTLEQVNIGLYGAQQKYFESLFLVHEFYGFPMPLPGGYLLMSLLGMNLVCGAIIRARKDWRRPGMLVAHMGMIFMLAGGWVTYQYALDGHMTLYENERSDEFVSYHDWEIAITEVNTSGSAKQYIVPGETFQKMTPEETREYQVDALPFDLVIDGYQRNCRPIQAAAEDGAVEGMILAKMAPEKEDSGNLSGTYATVVEKNGHAEQRGILFGYEEAQPWVVTVDGQDWAIDLRRRRWRVPFVIQLDKFSKDDHPGTRMAANYSSDVTKIEDGTERQIHIKMNEPLRHKGYTFFQSGWGPQNAPPGTPLFSTFSVVKNPADQWPKWACYVVTIGLSVHFLQKLITYLRRERRRRA